MHMHSQLILPLLTVTNLKFAKHRIKMKMTTTTFSLGLNWSFFYGLSPQNSHIYKERRGEIGVESACLLHFSPPDREKNWVLQNCIAIIARLQCRRGGDQAAISAWETAALLASPIAKPNRGGRGGGCGCRWTDWSRTIGELENNLYIWERQSTCGAQKARAAGIEKHVERTYRG